jgi:hypothetical protein
MNLRKKPIVESGFVGPRRWIKQSFDSYLLGLEPPVQGAWDFGDARWYRADN